MVLSGQKIEVRGQVVDTYDDHRMAMAFAPLAALGELKISEPEVVAKSYPSFWEDWSAVQ
jgi:3-phosphoshikimate 1-carboxyvinyltransferase